MRSLSALVVFVALWFVFSPWAVSSHSLDLPAPVPLAQNRLVVFEGFMRLG